MSVEKITPGSDVKTSRQFRPASRVGTWLLAIAFGLAMVGTLSYMASTSEAQLDPGYNVVLVVYQGETEVGRVYRDSAGSEYTEHWVLFPNYTFDVGGRPGRSMTVVAEPGPGYTSVKDFLSHVPFPKGSRYVNAHCIEFVDPPQPVSPSKR